MVTTPVRWSVSDQTQVNIVDGVGSHNDQWDPVVTQLDNGNVLVVWTSNSDPASGPGSAFANDLIGRIYDPLGNAVTGEIEINTAFNGKAEHSPSVTALAGGGFMVSYTAYRPSLSTPDWAIYSEVFNNAGTFQRSITVESPSLTNEWTSSEVASLSATSAMVAYSDGTDIYARFYNPATGAANGGQHKLTTQSTGDFQGLDVAALTSGLYLLTWAEKDVGNDQVHFKFYNTGTNTFGADNIVAQNLDVLKDPSVAALDNGGFVVTWMVDGSPGSGNSGVRAAVYNSVGVQTSTFNPMTTLPGNQTNPEVVALDNNEFVIAWVDENLFDIKGQRFDASGARIGSEFDIINHTSFVPGEFSMTRLADGRFQVAWQRANGSDSDVYTSIWDPRDVPNDPPEYPSNMVVGTPGNDTLNPLPAGTDVFEGWGGNDTIWVTASDVSGLTFNGGDGQDKLGILSTSGGLFGTMGLLSTTLNSVEILQFNAGGPAGLKKVLMSGDQASGFTTFDFAQGGAAKADELYINLSSTTTLDLSSHTILDFEYQHDLISILGDSSAETITGTSVDDTIDGGGGLDTLDGGGGFDTLSLSGYGVGNTVTTNLFAGTISSAQGSETAVNFENFQGGSEDDYVSGTAAHANEIRGGDGNDTIIGGDLADRTYGEAGNDRFIISAGDIDDGVEIIDGGTGTDTIVVTGGTGTNTINLRNESISSIEAIEFGFGSAGYSDTVFRTVELTAKQFNDGDVSLTSLMDGSNPPSGTQNLSVFMTSEKTLDLSGLTFSGWGSGNSVLITGDLTAETITGSSQNDTINAGGGDDVLSGGSFGIDVINGGAGDDIIRLIGIKDIVDGGQGDDTFIFDSFASAAPHQVVGGTGNDSVTIQGTVIAGFDINLDAGTWIHRPSGNAVTSILQSIENASGADLGDDILTGSSGDNILTGNGGDDVIMGGLGNDTIDGGVGIDTASYASSTLGVGVSLLNQGMARDTKNAGIDTLIGIENLIGGTGDDGLDGDAGANRIEGGGGDDQIGGGEGADTLFGDLGNDRFIGGEGADAMDGGNASLSNAVDGFDTVDYHTVAIGTVSINLDLGTAFGFAAAGDTFKSIEKFIGTTRNDYFAGDHDDNHFYGHDGNDTLQGRWGNDTLNGGAGQDNLYGGIDNDTIFGGSGIDGIQGGDGDDYMDGGDDNDTVLGGAGNDTLIGGAGTNILNGGGDNDLFIGGGGADDMRGSTGFDTVDYSSVAIGAVTINLDTGLAIGYGASGDVFSDIEKFIGTARIDFFAGDHGDNVFDGFDGNDTLQGRWGNDTLIGGKGQDTLLGGIGNDTLNGGDNIDGIQGGDGDDIMNGGAGTDTLLGGAGIDTINGGADNDRINGGSQTDIFLFDTGFGNDTIVSFENGFEVMNVSNVTGASAATLNVAIGVNGFVVADFGGADSIEFEGFTNVADITSADFVF